MVRSIKKQKSKTRYFIYVIIVLFATYLGYSTYVYLKSGVKDEGLVVCDSGKCFWAPGDIHTQVDIEICRQYFNLPLDKASTDDVHTHKERNLFHFEGKLLVDKDTNEILDYTPLMLKHGFERMEVRFVDGCINDKCNGDLCYGKPGTLKMWVNGLENNEFENYIWKDKDQILIKFE